MNKYNPKTGNHKGLPQRKSIRLKGYDYSQAGLYFITICTQNRECLFGNITVGADLCVSLNNETPIHPEMTLNDAGRMVEKWYYKLENKFPDIKCHEMMVMPNHFHCIIENVGTTVGADLRVCPNDDKRVCPNDEQPILGEHTGSPLHRVVQWFKTMSTNEYIRGVKNWGWQPFNKKMWQRNYWEHIIRNEQSYQRISEYIINNPKNWDSDVLYR